MSCEKEVPPPLPFGEEKIITILSDVHLAEAAVQSLGKTIKDSMSHIYYEQIYEIHDIKKKDFDKLMEMLRNRPKDMKRIYEKMMEKIEILEKELEVKKEDTTVSAGSADLIKLNIKE